MLTYKLHFFRCLSGLPQRTADAFVHREIDGLSTDEICKLLGITENNFWVILYRARMLLRRCLELAGFNQYALGKFTQFFTQKINNGIRHVANIPLLLY